MTTRLMTQAAYARRAGVSRQAISAQVKKGIIRVTPDGLIDPAAADQARAELVEPARSVSKHKPPADQQPPVNTHSGEGPGGSVNQTPDAPNEPLRGQQLVAHAKGAVATLTAQKLQMDLAERQGQLVETARVNGVLQEAFRELRDQLLSLPARVKGPLVMMQDESQIQGYLTEQLRGLLDHAAQAALDRCNGLR